MHAPFTLDAPAMFQPTNTTLCFQARKQGELVGFFEDGEKKVFVDVRQHGEAVESFARDLGVHCERSCKDVREISDLISKISIKKNAAGLEKLHLDGERIFSGDAGGSMSDCAVTLEEAGALHQRMTATRMILTGPFAPAFKKAKDRRELYLTVEGADYAFTVPVSSKRVPGREIWQRLSTPSASA